MAESTIGLKEGFKVIKSMGIDPLISKIELGDSKSSNVKAANYVKIYDMIFKMCIQRGPYNFSDQLYKKYEDEITKYCDTKVNDGFRVAIQGSDVPFLREWNLRWKNHKLIVEGLARFFTYLDRFHTANNDLILPLREKAFSIYKHKVFDTNCLKARHAILSLIEKERRAEDVDRELLRQAVLAFVEMGTNYNQAKLSIYKNQLETKITERAAIFYKRTSLSWMAQDSAPNYLKKAEQMLAQEKSRVDAYLNRNTLDPLINACYAEILKAHQATLLDKKTGVSHMLQSNSTEDLARLYGLYKRFPADLNPISVRFHDYIAAEGKRLVAEASQSGNANDPNTGLVSKLISLHDRFEIVVSQCFEKSAIFQKSLKRAFETFINEDTRVSNLLAEYAHEVLRKGAKVKISAANLESTLSNIAYLYLYIHDKDVFERSHQVFLKKRLLQGECENEHSEKAMIAKLKHGNFQWTNKLEGMFKDIQISKDLLKAYLNTSDAKEAKGVKLEVHTLSTPFWPNEQAQRALAPPEIKGICTSYTNFYIRDHSTQRIEWRYEQGNAEISVNFRTGLRRTLVCSTYHMILMLLFNQATKENKYALTWSTMLDLIGLSNTIISHHALSLCHPKVAVLKKRPNSPNTGEDHELRINPNFRNKLMRIPIKTMVPAHINNKKILDEERARNIGRKNQIDAAVVRIMKARKKMKHNLLVQEAMTQLQHRFRPVPGQIKKRVEALIDTGYLARDELDRGTYNYLA